MPKGAAVTRATLWVNGVAQEAAFTQKWRAQQAYEWVTVRHRDPLLVEQIDPDTLLVKASPVMPRKQGVKLRIGITAPLMRTADGITGEAPSIAEKNFGDGKMDVHVQTPSGMVRTHAPSVQDRITFVADYSYARPHAYAVRATHAANGGYIVVTPENGTLSFERTQQMPTEVPIVRDHAVATRVSTLWAHDQIERLVARGRSGEAGKYASAYRVISSISGAVVLEKQSDYDYLSLNRNMNGVVKFAADKQTSTGDSFPSEEIPAPHLQGATNGAFLGPQDQVSAPPLQGATSGTIGPDGFDATITKGVNTAATVRVNNLAKAEELLTIVAKAGGPLADSAATSIISSTRDANLFDGGLESAMLPLAIALLPLLALNFAPAIVCALRGIGKAARGERGALRLTVIATLFGVIAIVAPLCNQIACIGALAVLTRRRFLRHQAMKVSQAGSTI